MRSENDPVADESAPAMVVEGLTKRYGRLVAVDALDLGAERSSIVGFIGPNGAGKSTTMRILAGLQLPDEGAIRIGGIETTARPDLAKRLVGFVPQDLALFDYLTGEETLRFAAELRGVDSDLAEDRIDRWLERAELAAARGRLVREYSGGMKRKLAIGAALVANPPLLVLDESFTGLDPESTFMLQRSLRDYADGGGAVLLSTHVLEMLPQFVDELVIVAAGRRVDALSRARLDELVPAKFSSVTELYLDRVGKLSALREPAGQPASDHA